MLNRIFKHRHQTTDLQPRLPLEILYKIIDDHWETLRRDSGCFGLLSLSRTCKALESYCRPFLYRSLTVYGRERRDALFPTGFVTTPEAFTILLSRSLEVATLVQDLRVILPRLPPKEGTSLKRMIGIRQRLDAWQVLLSSNFSGVTKLSLVNGARAMFTEPMKTSLPNAIKQLECLQSFVWSGDEIPTDMVVRLSPRSLKHLALLPRIGYIHAPLAIYAANPGDVAHLERLRLSRYLDLHSWEAMFMNDGKPFDLASLTHLQLNFRFLHSILPYSQNILSMLTNLCCLHLGPVYTLEGSAESGLMVHLTHLKLVELVIPSGNSYEGLRSAFAWLEKAFRHRIHTSSTTMTSHPPAISKIQVVILFQSNLHAAYAWEDDYANQVERWTSTASSDKLTQLEGLNLVVAGFSRKSWFDKAWALRERRAVWWERHWDPVIDDYKSRVTACSCSGWEGVLD
ncbi:hypothetical protein BKA70DRAFT_1569804 [Coprinopsis sp. MPI-PUGE-AT-0042]|nr:hypothetical protein BKA70DRAFT_1569804 [Coprinopsis sp. MPI-PUGE-AT-0042]